MSFQPLKRSYSETALALWLERLADGWEGNFSPEELETARAIYRRGDVLETRLSNNAATVYSCWNGESAHAVVEWEKGRLSWRTTLASSAESAALAAASLYEVEEFLGDELAERVLEDEPATTVPHDKNAPLPSEIPESPDTAPPPPPETPSPRELVLSFFVSETGEICCVPMWSEHGSKLDLHPHPTRRPAYGAAAPAASELLPPDSGTLLRLATHARRCGFALDVALCGWRLQSPSECAHFAREELPRWCQRWQVEGAQELLELGRKLTPPPLLLNAFIEPAHPDLTSEDDPWENYDSPEVEPGPPPRSSERTTTAAPSYRLCWRLRLGKDWLPESIVQHLVRHPNRPIFSRTHGLVSLSRQHQELLARWANDLAPGEAMPRYAMLSVLNDAELQAKPSAELTRWRNALLREPTQLPGLPAFLRPYQGRGVAWLAHMLEAGTHPLLADEMGLGKTLQVLALLLQKPLDAPALIACPASVVPVWQEEIRRFFPSTPVRILERGKVWHPDDPPAIWLTSYAQLRQHRALLEKITFSHAVLDEAQFIKNPDAKATQACMAIQARHRIALTGTPIENHPDDLWSIFHFLMPGLLGKRHAFETKLNRDPDFLSHITCQITPFVLRRTKQSVAPELPPKVIMSLPCPMGKTQHELYRKIVEEGLATLGNDSPDALLSARSMSFLSLLTRLRQAACDPGLLPTHDALPPLASGKITTLLERLENILASGQKAVVFSQFVSLLERVGTALAERFPKTPLFRLTGQTQHREVPVAAFQNRAGASVMLVSLRAGGTGITLHSAEYVFLLDPWWNPAVEAQAIDRVHRIGQGNTTFVYRMIAPNTVEARVEALKETKQELFSKIIGDLPDMSDWSKHFPSLRALIE